MTFDLHVPRGGENISASRTAQLMREVRSNRLLPSPDVLISRGPNGTHIRVRAVRGGGGTPPGDLGCFRLEKTTDSNDEPMTVFGNQYYRVGDILKQTYIQTTVEDLLDSAGTADSAGVMPLFVALKISALPFGAAANAPRPNVEGYGSLSALTQAQGDLDYHVIPLYLMDVTEDEDTGERSFVVRCDFRRGVVAQQWEELSA